MTTNYRELLGIQTLADACGVAKEDRNLKQRKAIRNIKYCANDQWQFVNSWYDNRDEDARAYMMNPRELFDTIYNESLKNVYDEGSVHFGTGAEAFLKDVRFCGKEFLKKVVFLYTAKLLEESVEEVDGTEEDAQRVYADLLSLKKEIYGEAADGSSLVATVDFLCHDVVDGDNLVECLAISTESSVKVTKKGEKWISLPKNLAVLLSQYLKAKASNLEYTETRSKINYKNETVNLILNLGTNPYLWSVK